MPSPTVIYAAFDRLERHADKQLTRPSSDKLVARATKGSAQDAKRALEPMVNQPGGGGGSAMTGRLAVVENPQQEKRTRSGILLREADHGPMRGRDRNQPCPCQSGRKFKRCHGRA